MYVSFLLTHSLSLDLVFWIGPIVHTRINPWAQGASAYTYTYISWLSKNHMSSTAFVLSKVHRPSLNFCVRCPKNKELEITVLICVMLLALDRCKELRETILQSEFSFHESCMKNLNMSNEYNCDKY